MGGSHPDLALRQVYLYDVKVEYLFVLALGLLRT